MGDDVYRFNIITKMSAAVAISALLLEITIHALGLPLPHELAHLICILGALAVVASHTYTLAVLWRAEVIARITNDVNMAVADQIEQLAAVIAEEMRLYGESRAIDSAITTRLRVAAEQRHAESTLDLGRLRPHHSEPTDLAAVRQQRSRG